MHLIVSLIYTLICSFFFDASQIQSVSLPLSNEQDSTSLFAFLYERSDDIDIIIKTDFDQLFKAKYKEEYQGGDFNITIASENINHSFTGRIRTRGNIRKKVCDIPPFKIDLSKEQLREQGFAAMDKLKLVLPCDGKGNSQERLYKEHFVYQLYSLIDTNCLKTRLARIKFIDDGEEELNMIGIIVEDEEAYALRKNAKVIYEGVIRTPSIERLSFLKMLFFQYMIANTDWAISNKHNIEFVKLPDQQRITALPYDFDYSGFVGQPYAIPNESLGLKNIHERYFFPYKMSDVEFDSMIEYYLSIENQIYALCEQPDYFDEKTKGQNKSYLESFFKLLHAPKYLRSQMMR